MMARSKSFMSKINPWHVIIGIVIISLLLLAIFKPEFFDFLSDDGLNVSDGLLDSSRFDCDLDFNKNIICSGDMLTGTVIDGKDNFCILFVNDGTGWRAVWTGNTNNLGIWTDTQPIFAIGSFEFKAVCDVDGDGAFSSVDCLTNSESLIVNACDDSPTPSGWEEGDVVSDQEGGSSGGSAGGGSWDISIPGNFIEDGDCRLGVRLSTSWDYANDKCSGLQGFEGVRWDFYDSYGLEYTRTDNNPIGLGMDICPVGWDGVTDWRLTATPTLGLPECLIDYDWTAQIYVCECD